MHMFIWKAAVKKKKRFCLVPSLIIEVELCEMSEVQLHSPHISLCLIVSHCVSYSLTDVVTG